MAMGTPKQRQRQKELWYRQDLPEEIVDLDTGY